MQNWVESQLSIPPWASQTAGEERAVNRGPASPASGSGGSEPIGLRHSFHGGMGGWRRKWNVTRLESRLLVQSCWCWHWGWHVNWDIVVTNPHPTASLSLVAAKSGCKLSSLLDPADTILAGNWGRPASARLRTAVPSTSQHHPVGEAECRCLLPVSVVENQLSAWPPWNLQRERGVVFPLLFDWSRAGIKENFG